MRELGRALGVEAMSLYNHVADKEDLLDNMLDLLLREIDMPDSDVHWREAMRRRAVSAQNVFASHGWASTLVDSRQRGGPGRLAYFEAVIGSLRRAGFSIAQSAHAFSLIDSYIYGFALQSANVASTGPDTTATASAFLSALAQQQYPHLAEMAHAHAHGPGYNPATDFEFGLDIILDGLERTLKSSRA